MTSISALYGLSSFRFQQIFKPTFYEKMKQMFFKAILSFFLRFASSDRPKVLAFSKKKVTT